jgi:hypothetical protein
LSYAENLGDRNVKKLIGPKLAGNILLAAFGLLAIFHVFVLLGIIPADIVWGGRIQGVPSNLLTLEAVAILVTLVFIVIIAAKTGYFQAGRLSGAVNVGVWLIFVYLLLNTLGNLASGVSLESLIAAPVTIILALCAFRLAIEK